MPSPDGSGSIISMPDTSQLTRRALVEIRADGSASSNGPIVRRYRLARVPRYTAAAPVLDHFARLRRSPH